MRSELTRAIRISTTLTPPKLLDALKDIERTLGRNPTTHNVRFGPRPIDLDILRTHYPVLHDVSALSFAIPRFVGSV